MLQLILAELTPSIPVTWPGSGEQGTTAVHPYRRIKVPSKPHRRSCLEVKLPGNVGPRFRRELIQLLDGLQEESFKAKYLREEILSKYCDATTTPADVRQARAIAKWLEVEGRNERTNVRLQMALAMDKTFGWVTWEVLRDELRSLIARVLGPLEYPAIVKGGSHTNGASTRVSRSPSAALMKLSGDAHISDSALKHWFAAFSNTRLSDQNLALEESSVLFTVPKKSDIDRVACKEPEANMLLQRSVGNHIRKRLRVFGIDLNDQTVNQRLAQEGSAERKLGTVDLSSASDSVTRQLVLELLPWDWYSLLDDLRVKSTLINGQIHHMEMFSSMGNGFTFELESLLFYAITRVTCKLSRVRGRISVYGDDIIAPVGIIPRLGHVLGFLGFKMNLKKTHFTGSFRESCGRHYNGGFDVTPFYIRREVSELPDLVNHLNHLLEWDGRGWGFFTTKELWEFWQRWSSLVPSFLWGGIDPHDNTCLVTGDSPRRRMMPIMRASDRPVKQALTHWLLNRDHLELPLEVNPQLSVGWRSKPVIHCGERTTWDPGAIWR